MRAGRHLKAHLLVFGGVSLSVYVIHFMVFTFNSSHTTTRRKDLIKQFLIRKWETTNEEHQVQSIVSDENDNISFKLNSKSFLNSSENQAQVKMGLFNITQIPLTPVRGKVILQFSMFPKRTTQGLFPLLINNRRLCHLPNGQAPYLLIIVPSVLSHTIAREVIRETWANVVYNGGYWAGEKVAETIKLIFLLGGASYHSNDLAELQEEASMYEDIIVSDFVDSYTNLSIKMGVGLHWSNQFCEGVNHTMKVDEDTFVHIPQMIKVIKMAEQKASKFVLGRQHLKLNPKVLRRGKWKVGSEYPLPMYPRYVYGHSYVISSPALEPLLKTFRKLPTIENEDAFFTGILAQLSGVSRLSHKSFAGSFRHEVFCNVSHGYFVSVTACCNEHHRKIYEDIQHNRCDDRFLRQLPAHRCRYTIKHI